ncbi:hypothetical protein [Methylocystis parvus]|uniref:Uncharacterized protein n=1 Tax=Methylocystis parvus TaxID=134 RepID=A0A6B8M9E3_9HYPH|nr:hypothetical protein [Methylocystis parvus]QGM99286.1 hypothetical protein F7D14_18575 [Methylocystis parvus]WBK00325.1 hypothetical protein MMG94_00955 [Methylocystis parvus OBBP]
MNGPGPSEVVVEINTISGKEEIIVDVDSLKAGYLHVWPITKKNDEEILVELPREAVSGRSRAWISPSEINDKEACYA